MPTATYFSICHFIVCTLNVRSDLGTSKLSASIQHPSLSRAPHDSPNHPPKHMTVHRFSVLLQETSTSMLDLDCTMHILEHDIGQLLAQRANHQRPRKHSTGCVGHNHMVHDFLFTVRHCPPDVHLYAAENYPLLPERDLFVQIHIPRHYSRNEDLSR